MSLVKLGQFQSLLSSCILHIMGKVIETDIDERDKLHLRECSALAAESRRKGNHPFAAQLVDEDGTVLMSQENGFTVGGSAYHAETLLTLRAVIKLLLRRRRAHRKKIPKPKRRYYS